MCRANDGSIYDSWNRVTMLVRLNNPVNKANGQVEM